MELKKFLLKNEKITAEQLYEIQKIFEKYKIQSSDIEQIRKNPKYKNYSVLYLAQQLKIFEKGIDPLPIVAPANPSNNGIKIYNENKRLKFAQYFDNQKDKLKILKFVPASGAATRMFKHLFEFLLSDFVKPPELEGKTREFFDNIQKFAFYKDLDKIISEKTGEKLNFYLKEKDYKTILEYLLTEKGLNYGKLPKGLIKFHSYETEERTPFEEHILKFRCYSDKKKIRLHFTVGSEHKQKFENLAQKIIQKYKDSFNIEVSFSVQNPETDTVSVLQNKNEIYRENGKIFLRPAGHGALINNLQKLSELNVDLVFIKNIDNILTQKFFEENCHYKKFIGGLLLTLKDKIFAYLKLTENEIDNKKIKEIEDFLVNDLSIKLNDEYFALSKEEKIRFLRKKLNRPIRVCGMVKNQGQPGGGPFWTKNPDGTESLQIVELVQIDDKQKQDLLKDATHFNPVDMACWIKDYKGNYFNLTKYVDENAYIITEKNRFGIPIKVLELPGLWNGSMSDWNTVFVEIPVDIFNPVKTVNDLLKPKHQS